VLAAQIKVSPDNRYSIGMILAVLEQSSTATTARVQSLTDASRGLSDALTQIQSGTKKISTGIKGIKNMSEMLYNGTDKIMSGSDQLTHGLGILNQQQNTLIQSARALNSGSSQMNSGINQLNQRVGASGNGLSQALPTSDFLNSSGKQASLMAQPEQSEIKDLYQVNNYGEGLSPYILSLGLFIGALAFVTFFPLRRLSKHPESSVSWFCSKFSVSATIAIFQAILICTLMITVIGLSVTNVASFYFFAIVTSLSFFALTQFLATAFNNTGRAIGGILLVIQFGGSSGIFPVSLTPAFFQWIHALFPMTYSVNGLRQIIFVGNDLIYLTEQALILICIAVFSIVLTWLTYFLLLKKSDHFPEDVGINGSVNDV
jgi:YhgE/Pip C-terminal domain